MLHPIKAILAATLFLVAHHPNDLYAEPVIKFVQVAQTLGTRVEMNDWRDTTPPAVVTLHLEQFLKLEPVNGKAPSLITFQPPAAQPADPLPVENESQEPPTASSNDDLEKIMDHDFKPIGAIAIDIATSEGPLPKDAAAARFSAAGGSHHDTGFSRPWDTFCYAWVAPANAHRPLYFEDENLERYGHHWGYVQPAVSAAHFFTRIPAIPYMRGAWSPRDKIYSLGYYRPGSCAPFYVSRPPASLTGAAFEAAAIGGGVLLVP